MSTKQFSSPSSVKATLSVVRRKVTIQETNDSWGTIEQGILHLTECCKNGGCQFTTEMITGVVSLSRPLNSAINSKRSRVSGSAINLVSALVAGLGPSFEPLISLFFPSLLGLCAQTTSAFTRRAKSCVLAVIKDTNALAAGLGPSFEPLISLFFPSLLGLCAQTTSVFTCRAKSCVFAVIKDTKSPSLLSHLAKSLHQKSASARLVAAQGVHTYLDCCNFDDIENGRARLVEDCIRLTTGDVSIDVRQAGKKIAEAYEAKSNRAAANERLRAPLATATKKQLAVKGTAASQARPGRSLIPQRVTSGKPTTQRPQPGGKLADKKSRAGVLIPTVPLLDNGRTETARAARIRTRGPPSFKPTSRPTCVVPNTVDSSTTTTTDRRPWAWGVRMAEELAALGDASPQIDQSRSQMSITDLEMSPQVSRGVQRIGNPADERPLPIPTMLLPEDGRTETTRATQIRPPSFKPTSRKACVVSNMSALSITDLQIPSEASWKQAVCQKKPVWGGRPVTMCPKPAVKGLSGEKKTRDTRKRSIPITLPSSSARSTRQSESEAASSGEGSTSESTTPKGESSARDVIRPYIDTTRSRCGVKRKDLTSTTPKTPIIWPSHCDDLFAPSPNDAVVHPGCVPDRLKRAPRIAYRPPRADATPTPCIQDPRFITSHTPIRPLNFGPLFTPGGMLPPLPIPQTCVAAEASFIPFSDWIKEIIAKYPIPRLDTVSIRV
ncbi:hypothetical protein AZE42_10607 [Rhizopogon vesiculosus]|uniref:CLASP N-terminal domain-containing protein n=1 Tax=Rhizopogon vesiculosus TaxID=180088 RepID=A0A1J8QL95_9AGAM|nr:hypothetical protein AZE42_10607 [Rhizopogon vesiculosus]